MNHSNSSSSRERFQADGFVALPGFLQDRELSELITHIARFIAEVAVTVPETDLFYEDKADVSSLKQIQHMGDHDPWFHDLFTSGPFRDVAELLLGGPVIPKNMQYFNKPPMISSPTPPHQDGYYFMLEPCEAVTMWFALDEVDEENGCVRYVPGSHQKPMREHGRTKTLGFSQGIVDYPNADDLKNELPIPASPGDLLIHHAKTIHRADENRSKTRTRKALGFIYYSERAREDVDAHAAYKAKLQQELKASGKL